MTTILVTHDQEEVTGLASRVVLMNHERIERVGKPQDLYESVANGAWPTSST